MAVARLPVCKPMSSALPLVMMAAMLTPAAISITTSLLTAPGISRLTVPRSWLRADRRMSSSSVPTITDEALISA
jgi:hypothetical protein